jgi:Flp pilus assembly pilin Flp
MAKNWMPRMLSRLETARDVTRRQVVRASMWVYRDEKGQTPTEYLMIVAFMAGVIVLVFVNIYWPQVKTAAESWVGKVVATIMGPS